MNKIEKADKGRKPIDPKIKLSVDQLIEMVSEDIRGAEAYFDENIKPWVIARYELLNENADYYKQMFPKLTQKMHFSTSDVKDAIEWMMPSMIEAFFGPDKIVGIFGRTPDDNPEPLEKTIKYQVTSQNDGYKILGQWLRDSLEAGLGTLFCDWERISELQDMESTIPQDVFANLPPEHHKMVKQAKDSGDGGIWVKVRRPVRVKDQPVLRNVMPGGFVWLPQKTSDDRYVFEAVREWVLLDDLIKLEQSGKYKNVSDIDVGKAQAEAGEDRYGAMQDIMDAITNYKGENDDISGAENNYEVAKIEGQEGRQVVMRYICWGMYDVDGDGILERVQVTYCGGQVLEALVYEQTINPVVTLNTFEGSYQRWKMGVADFLQTVQDLKTAIVMQIAANVAYNNDRPVMIDGSQPEAISDVEKGKKVIRLKRSRGDRLDELMKPMPENPISEHAWNMLEWLTMAGENKVGVSRQTQGLDGDTLAKMTAFGVNKVMGAQQQRLRLLARNAASGFTSLYRRLIELNQEYLDQAFYVRISGEHYQFQPDDIRGHFDTEVTSNIGLNNKEAMVGSLMMLFSQVLPAMLQTGTATPIGIYRTAGKIIEHMGFPNPEELTGMSEEQLAQQMQQQDVMAQLPQILATIMQQVGIPPEQAAAAVQGLQQVLQPQQQQPQPGQQAGGQQRG